MSRTFASERLTDAIEQIELGSLTGNTIVLSAPEPSSANKLVYTFPDAGLNANVILSEGVQTINALTNFTNIGFRSYVGSTEYTVGTASQSGNTLTGVGTTFVSGMIGGVVRFADATTCFITGFVNSTTLIVEPSQTVPSQAYTLYYGLMQDSNGYTGFLNINVAQLQPNEIVFTDQYRNLTSFGNISNAYLSNSSLTVNAGTGLTGGGLVELGGAITLDLANTTVTPGTYGSGNAIPQFTVNAQGQVTLAALVGVTNPYHVMYVQKNPSTLNGTEFISLSDAIAAIPVFPDPEAPAINKQWVVYVYPDTYAEPAITIPSHVYVSGIYMEGVIFVPETMGYPLFTLENNSGLQFCSIWNTDSTYPAIRFANSGGFALCHKVTMENCVKGIECTTDGNAVADTEVFLEYVDTTNSTDYALKCMDFNNMGGFGTYVSIENFFTFGHSDNAVMVSGNNTQLLSQAAAFESDNSGNAIVVMNGGYVDLRGCAFQHFEDAIKTLNDSSTPTVLASASIFADCVNNFNIVNPLTQGHSDGYTEYLKTQIPKVAPFFIANKDQHIITVGQKGTDFTSIAAAIAAITDNSPIHRYTIYIGPGIYPEPQLVMKPYVTLLGYFQTQCIIMATDPTKPLIVGAGYAAIDKLTLTSANPFFPPNVYCPYLLEFMGDPTGVHFRADNIVFDVATGLVNIGSTLGPCIMLLLNPLVNMSAPFTTGIKISDAGPSNYPIMFMMDNMIWNADVAGFANFTQFMEIESTLSPAMYPNVIGAIANSTIGQNITTPNGLGIEIKGACYIACDTTIFGGFTTALSVPNSAEITTIVFNSLTFMANVNDISIQNPQTQGTLFASAQQAKTSIVPGVTMGILLNDPNGGTVQNGNLFQGIEWANVTNISEQIQQGGMTGALMDQPIITELGALNISVNGGTGYVHIGDHLKYIEWNANALISLPDNALNWIYVDAAELIQTSTSKPDHVTNVILGTAHTYSGNVQYVQHVGRLIDQLPSNIDEVLRDVFGPIVRSGCIASPGSSLTSRAVAVSSGSYNLSVQNFTPSLGDNVTMTGYYGGVNEVTLTDVPLMWDNMGTLTAIGAGMWVKHSIHILTDLVGNTQYFLVYGQEQFTSELDADNGGIPTAPTSFVENMCPISGVIVTDSDPNSPLAPTRFRDIRPTLAFRSEGVTATADHNSLLNLTVGDAHPQYFRTDGTRTMTGPVLLGTQNIVGAGGNLLNGVDITAHASRHLPGGADALATAVPVTIGTVNMLGSAASFSRSDHVHAIGTVGVANGGTGLTATPTNGQVPIGNGTGYTLATITPTANQVSVTNGAGSITLSTPTTFLAPGTIRDTTGMLYSTSAAVAAAGTIQTSATPLTTSYNIVTSSSGLNTGVKLPTPSTSGYLINLVNRSANTINVYPDVGGAIDAAGVNVSVPVPPNASIQLQAASITQWYTIAPVTTAGSGTSVSYGNGQTTVSIPNGAITNAMLVNSSLTVTAGTGLSGGGLVSLGGSITLTNTGVTALTAGTAISVSASTGNITITNTGVTSFSAGTTGFLPSSASTGAVVLSGTLNASNGGTGVTATPTNGQLLIGNGTGYTLATLTPGTGLSVANGAGTITLTNTGVTALTAGTAISVSASTGSITVTNTGVTSAVAGTGISVSASSGAVTFTNTGVTSFSAGTTGFSPTSASTGAVVLSGTLNASNGGTGVTATPANGQLLIGNGTGFTLSTLTAGTGISVTNSAGAITLTNTGVTSFQTSLNGLTPSTASTGAVTLAGTLATTSGGTGTTVAPTAGQLLVGQTGGTFVPFTVTTGTGISTVVGSGTFQINNTGVIALTAGTAINVSASTGSITVTNTGVTSAVAGTGISVSASSGAVTFTNTGVTSFSAGTTGFSPTSASTGAVVLSGTLNTSNGGTGITATPTNGQLLIGNGTGFTLATLTAGTGISVTNGSGAITLTNTGVTSFQTSLNGLTPSTASTGAVTLAGTLATTSGGTGTTVAPTAGQLLVGQTGGTFVPFTVTTGTGISTVVGSGTFQINNTGVTSNVAGTGISVSSSTGAVTITNTGVTALTAGTAISVSASTGSITVTNTGVTSAVAGTGISVSASSGAVTFTNTGVTSFSAGTTGFSPTSASTGAVVLSGTLNTSNGGTGITATPTNGQLLIGNGTGFTLATLTAGTGVSVTNASGAVTITNTGVTSLTAGSGISVSASTGAVTVSTATIVSTLVLPISSVQLTVTNVALQTFYYTVWKNATYSSATTRTVVMWVIPGSTARSVRVSVLNNGGATLGTTTIAGGAATGLYSFTFTAPGADTRLDFQINRSAGGGTDPIIRGITIELA
jgi:hypothetical protein